MNPTPTTSGAYKRLSPSQIAVKAAGLAPEGKPHGSDFICTACACHFDAAMPATKLVLPDSFTDYSAFLYPQGEHLCGWCATVMGKDAGFTQRFLNTVITTDGVFGAFSKGELAYWLLNPPVGEWLFLRGDQKVQHLVFRAPVNQSQQVYRLAFGDLRLTVRKRHLEVGLQAAKDLTAISNDMESASVKRKSKPKFSTPFAVIDWKFATQSNGMLRRELLLQAAQDPRTAELVTIIQALSVGELWAVSVCLNAELAPPTRVGEKKKGADAQN